MRCSGCGLEVAGGRAGCRAFFEEFLARDFTDFRYGRLHRMMVDVYCLQHPAEHCASAKSLAAHLTGLCCALEHDRDAEIQRSVQRWLSGPSPVEKPALPESVGSMTIADVRSSADPDDYARALHAWARSTSEAYAPLHATARRWIELATARPVREARRG